MQNASWSPSEVPHPPIRFLRGKFCRTHKFVPHDKSGIDPRGAINRAIDCNRQTRRKSFRNWDGGNGPMDLRRQVLERLVVNLSFFTVLHRHGFSEIVNAKHYMLPCLVSSGLMFLRSSIPRVAEMFYTRLIQRPLRLSAERAVYAIFFHEPFTNTEKMFGACCIYPSLIICHR